MNWKTLSPAVYSGLVVAAVNAALIAILGIASLAAAGITSLAFGLWGIPLPLLPLLLAIATPIVGGVWLTLGRKYRHLSESRTWIILLGASPWLLLAVLAFLGSFWLMTVPGDHLYAIIVPAIVAVGALFAGAACAACLHWTRAVTATTPDPSIRSDS